MVEDQSVGVSVSTRRATPDGSPLLTTRLTAGAVPDTLVARPRLHRLLDAGTAGPVTLVAAPAGWGKTVLLSSWSRGATGWLTVEPADRADQFWTYVAAALGVHPAGDAGEPDYLGRLVDTLAHRDTPAVLVLDDLHEAADPGLLAGLDFLVRHGADRLRLVLGSRTEPALALHRRRLSGEVTEIRATDLAFTTEEAADLLAASGAALPIDLTEELRVRTEGWPAGLRLAALALREHPDPTRYVAGFAGDAPEIAGYLEQEVLSGLTDATRDVLRRAAVVDRMSADLLDALAGGERGDEVLAEAERTGFVLALGTRPANWRCHRLLGDLLRARLGELPAGELRDLHRRAATWAAGHGRADDALRHALAAGDWSQAERVLLDQWPALVAARVPAPGGPPRGTADPGSVGTAPVVPTPPAELLRDRPELALALAAGRFWSTDPGTPDEIRALIDAGDHGTPRLRLIAAAMRLSVERVTGDPVRVTAAANQLLDLVDPPTPDTDATSGRALGHEALGMVRLGAGDLPDAEEHLATAIEAARSGPVRTQTTATAWLALAHALRGRLRAGEETARSALALPACRAEFLPADCAAAYLALALVAGERDRPDEAETHLTLVDGSLDRATDPVLAALAELVRSRLRRDRGDRAGSFWALRAAQDRLVGTAAPLVDGAVRVAEADLRVANGDVAGARGLLGAVVGGSQTARDGADTGPGPAAAVVLARIELLAGDPAAALRTLPSWDGPAAGDWPLPVRIEAGMLEALTARRTGDGRRASRVLERVLDLAGPDGYRRLFTRAQPPVRDLLAEHLDSGTAHWPLLDDLLKEGPDRVAEPVPPVTLGEALTERELTVLRYLQSILSNVEIASEMSLSVNTVKTHVRNIYRKLDASRRREAVRRARELRLL